LMWYAAALPGCAYEAGGTRMVLLHAIDNMATSALVKHTVRYIMWK
jgi:hypothetical protein